MRPIKFRAWDEANKKMVYFDLTEIMTCGELGSERRVGGEGVVIWAQGHFNPDVILMQFTGLKDKNGKGKEVYNDDYCLIRVDFSFPDAEKSDCKNLKVHIFYDDELFAWCWHAPGKYGGRTAQFNEYEFEILEVIGNTTEHPKLLETKQ